jgi:hypothetical protein
MLGISYCAIETARSLILNANSLMTNAIYCFTLRDALRLSIGRLWDEVQEIDVIAKQQPVVLSPGSANISCVVKFMVAMEVCSLHLIAMLRQT